jgi:hypothetical protein
VNPMKLAVVLSRRHDVDASALAAALDVEAGKLTELGYEVKAGVVADPEAFAGTAHGEVVGSGIDGVLLVVPAGASSLDVAVAQLPMAAKRLAAVANLARSGAIVGEEHVVLDGEGPLWINFALHRAPAMTHEQFSDYWLHVHGKMARDAPRRRAGGYRQLHADPERTAAIARAAGFGIADYDGLVSSDHQEVETMKKAFSHPAVRDIALADERNFIDHSTSAISIMTEVAR